MANLRLNVKVQNLKDITEHLKKYQYATGDGFELGIRKAAERLLQLSLNIVPVDTGYLRSTAKIVQSGKGFRTICKIIYSAYYSIWVHERLDLAHGAAYNRKYAEDIAAGRKKRRRPQEQAKFIETPLRQNKKELVDIVRRHLKETLKRAKANGRSSKSRRR